MKKNNSTAISTISTPSFEDFKKLISERNLDAIKILIDNNQKFPMPFNDYLKALHYSIELGDVEVVELLIEDMDPQSINHHEMITNMSPDSIQPNRLFNKTALHKALEKGHIEIVDLLLKKITQCSINKCDKDGKTALHFAAQEGRIDVVQLLVSHMQYYEINHTAYSGETALHFAAENGRIDLVALLIEKGVDLNQVNKKNDSTALHKAAEKGHTNLVKWIIEEKKVDINQADKYGKTSLHFAAENGHTNLVQWIIKEKKMDINQAGGGSTALHLAVENGHTNLVQWMIEENEVNINLLDGLFGQTVLHTAAQHGHEDIVEILLNTKGVNINQASGGRKTALHFAAERGSIKVVELLLQKMTPEAINQANHHGYTALHSATPRYSNDYRDLHVVDLLLPKMTPEAINQANHHGHTVLGLAAEYNNTDLVNLITYYLKIHNLTAIEPYIDKHIEDSFEFYSGGSETKKLITADVFKKLLLQKYPELALFEEYLNNLQTSANESSSFEVKESVEKFCNIAWEFKEESTNKMDDIDLMFVEQGSFEGIKMTFLQIKYGYASLFDIIEILEKFKKGETLESEQTKLLEYFKKDLRINNDSELFDEKGGINSKLIIEDYIKGKAVQDKEKEAIEFFIHNPEYRVAASFFKMAIEKHKDKLVDRINSDKDFKDAILELKNYILPLEIKKFIEELERQDSTDETESSKGFEVETANGDYEDFNEVERKLDEEDLESTSVTTFSDRLTDYHNEARIEYTGEGCLQSIGEEIVESNNLFSNPRDVFERHGIELNVVLTGDIENSGAEGSL